MRAKVLVRQSNIMMNAGFTLQTASRLFYVRAWLQASE